MFMNRIILQRALVLVAGALRIHSPPEASLDGRNGPENPRFGGGEVVIIALAPRENLNAMANALEVNLDGFAVLVGVLGGVAGRGSLLGAGGLGLRVRLRLVGVLVILGVIAVVIVIFVERARRLDKE